MIIRYRIARGLVWVANYLVRNQRGPTYWPVFRPVDTFIPGIGTEHSCASYSYEGLKSLVEQDGPDGFGATCTVAWLIGEEGWINISDMEPRELRRTLAMSGLDIDGDLPGEDDNEQS